MSKVIKIGFDRSNKENDIKLKIVEIAFDDQNSMAVVEATLSDRTSTQTSFLTFSAIIPLHIPLLFSFQHIRIFSQKMIIELDHTVVADFYRAFDKVFCTIKQRLESLKLSKIMSTDDY